MIKGQKNYCQKLATCAKKHNPIIPSTKLHESFCMCFNRFVTKVDIFKDEMSKPISNMIPNMLVFVIAMYMLKC